MRIATLAAALLLAATPALADRYKLRDLGTLGGELSLGSGINDKNEVVGYSGLGGTNPGEVHAFKYSRGQMQDLRANAYAVSINRSGAVAGYAANPYVQAWILSDSGETLLPSYSLARSINKSGAITGEAYFPDSNQYHAYTYANGVMTDLGTLGGFASVGNAINSRGEVAGGAIILGNTAQHAFLYSNGAMLDLGTLGGVFSSAHAINEHGHVVGASQAPSTIPHAFLFKNGFMTDLDPLGTFGSIAKGINDDGVIVGTFVVTPFRIVNGVIVFEVKHGFVYRRGRLIDLNTLTWSRDGSHRFVTLNEATGINNEGSIVANGTDSRTGQTHAYLLTRED
jgi:probable HAF family extracellular repeat protein